MPGEEGTRRLPIAPDYNYKGSAVVAKHKRAIKHRAQTTRTAASN